MEKKAADSYYRKQGKMAQYSTSSQSSTPSHPQSFTNLLQTASFQNFLKSPRSSSIVKLWSPSTPHVDLSDKLGRDSKLNSNEHKCCIDNNLYLYCGSKNHKVDECPRKQLVRAWLLWRNKRLRSLRISWKTRVWLPRLSTNWESHWTCLCNYEFNTS